MSTLNRSVHVDNQTDIDIDDDLFEVVFQVIQKNEGLSESSFVNLLLSNDGSIKRYNRQYLGRDENTDVISFQADLEGIPILGDIIIDTNIADIQKENRTISEEMQILFLHGLLHLLNYDHLAAKQEKIMKEKEKQYLKCILEKNNMEESTSCE